MKKTVTILATILLGVILDLIPMTKHLEAARPYWTLMVVMFWSLYLKKEFNVGIAWFVGLFLDLTKSYLIGLHGFIFVLATYLVKKYYLWIKELTLIEQTTLITVIFFLQTITGAWINGILGVSNPFPNLWFLPIITSTLIWPLVSNLLNELCYLLNLSEK